MHDLELLESRTDDRVFVRVRKATLCERCVGQGCDDWCERITQLLDQPRGYRVEFTLLVVGIAYNWRHSFDRRVSETKKQWSIRAVNGRWWGRDCGDSNSLNLAGEVMIKSPEGCGTDVDETGMKYSVNLLPEQLSTAVDIP